MKKIRSFLTENHKTYLILWASIILWSAFPVLLEIIGKTQVPPIMGSGLATLFAGLFMGVWLTLTKNSFKFFQKKYITQTLIVSFCIGFWMYGLLFIAAQYTDSLNIALLAFSEILYSFVFFGVLKYEKYNKYAYIGSFLILFGIISIMYNESFEFNQGDILVLLAYLLSPVGNLYQRKLRAHIKPEEMLFMRSVFAGIMLLSLSYMLEDFSQIKQIDAYSWKTLAFIGILFMGFQKILWIEIIHRVSITKANVLAAFEPIITAFLVILIFSRLPEWSQIWGFIPLLIGTLIIVKSRDAFVIKKK